MHEKALNLLKGAATRYAGDVDRFSDQLADRQEQVKSPEASSYAHVLLAKSEESLARAKANLAEIQASIATLEAAEPVNAISASFAPGMGVQIIHGAYADNYGTVHAVGPDGVVTVDIPWGNEDRRRHVHVKPSALIYTR
jgi:transcription antitermination factor NusG